MTGPEHYAESEHLISALPSCQCPASPCVHEQIQIARAQVHATLALAAATAEAFTPLDRSVQMWTEVIR